MSFDQHPVSASYESEVEAPLLGASIELLETTEAGEVGVTVPTDPVGTAAVPKESKGSPTSAPDAVKFNKLSTAEVDADFSPLPVQDLQPAAEPAPETSRVASFKKGDKKPEKSVAFEVPKPPEGEGAFLQNELIITVGDVVKFMTKDVMRERQSRIAMFYVLFLLCFLLLLYQERLGHQETIYLSSVSVRLRLQATRQHGYLNKEPEQNLPFVFENLEDIEGTWKWIRQSVDNLWPEGSLKTPIDESIENRWSGSSPQYTTHRVNIPLGVIVLRQFRVEDEESCSSGAQMDVIPKVLQDEMTKSCAPGLTADNVNTKPYGPVPNVDEYFICNNDPKKAKGTFVNSKPRFGSHADYNQPTKAFTILLKTRLKLADALDTLNNAERDKWIDKNTRAVMLEFVTYNQAEGEFVFTSALIEIHPTNAYLKNIETTPFVLLSLWTMREKLTFGLDFFIFAFILGDFFNFMYRQKTDRDVRKIKESPGLFRGISPWALFRMVMLGEFLISSYYRIQLWIFSFQIGGDFFKTDAVRIRIREDYGEGDDAESLYMWKEMADYSLLYMTWTVHAAVCVVLSWLRLFSFLRYYELANILTETISLAVGELVGLTLLGSIVIVGYAITGFLLYGNDLYSFRNFLHSLGTLLRSMVSGEVEELNDMVAIHKWESRFFTVTYQVLVWLILLNMILAIISGAFTQVQEGMQGQGEFAPLEYVRQWFARFGKKKDKNTAKNVEFYDYARARIDAIERIIDAEEKGLIRPEQKRQSLSLDPNAEPPKEPAPGEAILRSSDHLYNVIKSSSDRPMYMNRDSIERVYNKASKEVSASNRSVTRGELWVGEVSDHLKQILEEFYSIKNISETSEHVANANAAQDAAQALLTGTRTVLTQTALSELASLCSEIQACQADSAPLEEIITKVSTLYDTLLEDEDAIVEGTLTLKNNLEGLEDSLLTVQRSLNKWVHVVSEQVSQGTLWGAPSDSARLRALPVLTETAKGKGAVESLKKFTYTSHYQDRDIEAEYLKKLKDQEDKPKTKAGQKAAVRFAESKKK